MAVGGVVCWEPVHRCVVTDDAGWGGETEVCAAWLSSAWCVCVCVWESLNETISLITELSQCLFLPQQTVDKTPKRVLSASTLGTRENPNDTQCFLSQLQADALCLCLVLTQSQLLERNHCFQLVCGCPLTSSAF